MGRAARHQELRRPHAADRAREVRRLSTPGVADTEELVVGFAAWRKPKGGTTAVLLVGSDHKNGTLKPWNITGGSVEDLAAPFSVAVDDTYFADLGVRQARRHGRDQQHAGTIDAVTHGIRSFTTLPYVFISLNSAPVRCSTPPRNQASYTLVRMTARRRQGRPYATISPRACRIARL